MGAPDDEGLDLALRALADGNRRAILREIRARPQPVSAIARAAGLSQQTTSHHLGVLRRAGLAAGTRDGTRHLYAVDTDGLAAVRSYLDDFWPSRLAALRSVIEARQGEAPDAAVPGAGSPDDEREAEGHG